MLTSPKPFIGTAMPQREDAALLAGQGCYTDDVALNDPLHVAFVRSPVAAGMIQAMDLSGARAAPGVVAAHTADDLGPTAPLLVNPILPIEAPLAFPILGTGRVLSIGQPLAAILATSRGAAQDAADLVEVDMADGPIPAPTRVAGTRWRAGDPDAAFAAADHVVEVSIEHPRLAPCPMEPRGIAIRYHRDTASLSIYHSTQTPHRTRSELAQILAVDPDRLHVIAPSVGGAFGMKASLYPEEVLAVWAALTHRRDVKWIATRSEDFLAGTHGRGLHTRGRLALDADGRFRALQARVDAPLGGWLPNSALIPAWNAARILPSAYVIPDLDLATQAHSHPLPPTGIYRGAGRPEANTLIERLIDKAARRLGVDPLALRQKNMLRPDALPHRTATGETLDSGDYAGLLAALAGSADYAALIARRDAARAGGGLCGLGLAFYLEPSGAGWESARVTLEADGSATVASGSSSQGQGRQTAYAQIAADALGLLPGDITVLAGDTATCPEGIGALASRSTPIGGSAVLEAAQAVRGRRDGGEPLPITAEVRYENKGQAWGYGAYLVLVDVDRDTGQLTILAAHAADDAGRIVNPAQVEGQIRGGFAQGLGEATMERMVLDEDGQLLTGSLMDYALPRAADIPPLAISKQQTPSPMNSLGAKGVGEAGTIGAPIAILNAAIDALAPLGITDLQMPLTPARLWQALHNAPKGPRP